MAGPALRTRVVALVGAALVLVLASGLAVTVAVDRATDLRTEVDTRLQPAAADARRLARALVDQETGERGFVITGERDFLEPYDAGRKQERSRIRALRRTFADDPAMLARVDRVASAADLWRRVGPAREIRARTAGGPAVAERLVAEGEGKRAFDRVRRQQDVLIVAIEQRVADTEDSAADSERFLRYVLLTSSALLLVLVLAIAVLLRQWVLMPVETLRSSLRRVAAGDLDSPVRAVGPPEVEAIGADAEAMRRRLLAELDTSRAALEGLEQHSPVVAGMRAELAAQPLTGVLGLGVAGVLRPVEGVLAGDWWQTIIRPSGAVALVVADVSGHGASAGLVALRFKQRITTLLQTDLDLLSAFTIATASLDPDPERFVTGLVVEMDPRRGSVRYVNAGHPSALLLRRRGEAVEKRELSPTGPIISVLDGEWTLGTALVEPGDLLVALTDGVLEARSSDGAEFGEDGVLEVVRGLRPWTPETAVAEIDAAVRAFAAEVRQDDVTVVAAQWNDPTD
jgi:sigma-B regulation protein RsbU (phosphoserine phosphatase)